MCFQLAVYIPSYSKRSNGVHFPCTEMFLYDLTVLQLQGFEVTHPIFEISMSLRTRLTDAFHRLEASECQLANLVANRARD